jgi:hypothetical protein
MSMCERSIRRRLREGGSHRIDLERLRLDAASEGRAQGVLAVALEQAEELGARLLPTTIRATMHEHAEERPRMGPELEEALAPERRDLALAVDGREHLLALVRQSPHLAAMVFARVDTALARDDDLDGLRAHEHGRRRAEMAGRRKVRSPRELHRAHRRDRERLMQWPVVCGVRHPALVEPALLVAERFRRDPACRIRWTHVVHLTQPRGELRQDILTVYEGASEEEARLDEADEALDRALLVARSWRAERGDHPKLGDEIAQIPVQHDGRLADGRDANRLRVVEDPLLRRTAERVQAMEDAAHDGLRTLIDTHLNVHEARVFEAPREEDDLVRGPVRVGDRRLAEVELRVLAGQAIEAHDGLRGGLGAQALHERRHRAAAARVAPRARPTKHLGRHDAGLVDEQLVDTRDRVVIRLGRPTALRRVRAAAGSKLRERRGGFLENALDGAQADCAPRRDERLGHAALGHAVDLEAGHDVDHRVGLRDDPASDRRP